MKKCMKKGTSLLCALAIVLSLVPAAFAEGENDPAPAETYEVPAETYVAPVETYEVPVETYVAPVETYEAPAETYVAPVETYVAPAETYVAPVETCEAPVETCEAPVETYEAPVETYVAPAETYVTPMEESITLFETDSSDPAPIGESDSVNHSVTTRVGEHEVTVTGNIPEEAELQVAKIPSDAAAELTGKDPLFAPSYAYDIRLVVDGEVWQPEEHGEEVEVSVSSAESEEPSEAENSSVLHVKTDLMEEDGTISEEALQEAVAAVSDGTAETEVLEAQQAADSLTFHTTGFSAFVENVKTVVKSFFGLSVEYDEAKVDVTSDESSHIITLANKDESGEKAGVLVTNADGVETASASIRVASSNLILKLKDVAIRAKEKMAGILVESNADLDLVLSGENTVIGGENHAGIEVEWESGKEYASLTIDGDGTLNATGGSGSGGAGIGGSKGEAGVYGDITINGGTVNATGTGRSAGIGSSDNPMDGTSHGSYKYTEEQWGTITINDGNVTAKGVGNGAGIGGGNHTSSGKIVINGGTIYAEGDSGIGSGLGSSKGSDKGPGYYYADVTINGGTVTAYATDNMGAGIGGGMYSDASVKITGGDVTAGVSLNGKEYQGGAGIGGGYQGVAQVEITGGTVNATGGNGAPGIGNGALGADTTTSSLDADGNPTGTKNVRTGKPTIATKDSYVAISGGTVTAQGGVHAAGIGSGNASEWSSVTITGGTVNATGGLSTEKEMAGGAGIGSGTLSSPDKKAYAKETEVHVLITGGDVTATGGWGASGIGSGAGNLTASTITIGSDAYVEAYSDGTKFAIDSRDGQADLDVAGDVLQATFVYKYEEADGTSQNPTGLKSILVTNKKTGKTIELTGMREGYRSFATTVAEPGKYTVYSEEEGVSNGSGRYFGESDLEQRGEEQGYDSSKQAQYTVDHGTLSDNHFLFPVKSVVVSKIVVAEDGLNPSDINTTCYFALWDRSKEEFVLRDGEIWMESVDIVNGIPQGRAIFSDVNDSPAGGYGIWEIDRENPYNSNLIGMGFGSYELRLVTTTHGETDGNDATIDHRTWTDYVSVINTYVPIPEPESDPAETPDPASDPLVPSSPTPFTPVNPGTPEVPVEAAGVINNLNDGLTIEDYMTPLAGGINMNEGDCFN